MLRRYVVLSTLLAFTGCSILQHFPQAAPLGEPNRTAWNERMLLAAVAGADHGIRADWMAADAASVMAIDESPQVQAADPEGSQGGGDRRSNTLAVLGVVLLVVLVVALAGGGGGRGGGGY